MKLLLIENWCCLNVSYNACQNVKSSDGCWIVALTEGGCWFWQIGLIMWSVFVCLFCTFIILWMIREVALFEVYAFVWINIGVGCLRENTSQVTDCSEVLCWSSCVKWWNFKKLQVACWQELILPELFEPETTLVVIASLGMVLRKQ